MRSQRSQPDLRPNSNILEQRDVGKAERQSPARTKTPVIAAVTRHQQQQQMPQLSVDNGMKTPRSDSALASPKHQQQRPPPIPTLTPRPYRRPSLVALPMPQSTIQLLEMLRNGVDPMNSSSASPAQEGGGGGGGGQTVSELTRSWAGRCTPRPAVIVPHPASRRPSSAYLNSHPASRASAVHSPRSSFFGKMQQLHEQQGLVFSKPVSNKSSANLLIGDVGDEDVVVTSEIDGRVDPDLVKSTNIFDLGLSDEGEGRLEQLCRERGTSVSLRVYMTVEQAAVTLDRQDAVLRNILLLKNRMAKRLDASLKGSSAWKKRLRQRQEETHQSVHAIRRHRMDIVQGILQHMTSLAERQRIASACFHTKNPKKLKPRQQIKDST